jgi:TM2 domain-containing membrane protein YozV
MNCANHPDRENAAFCQNCGKPVCSECVRNVGSSIFCEPCLAARVAGSAPPAGYGYTSYTGGAGYPPAGAPATGEPSPGLAALLGFIPGVGAMYNGQYAKGLAHLIVFAVLVSLPGIFHLFILGWIFYMVFEAYHTAKARREGAPLPNPFGLNDLSERLGFGKAWPGSAPNVAVYPAATGPDPAAQPTGGAAAGTPSQEPNAPGPYAPPVNPYTPPYTPPYAPPYAPAYTPPYSYPYDPPGAPAAPVPPYADVKVPYYRRFPSGAIWLIVLGLIFLVGDNGFFHFFHRPVFWPILTIAVGVWIFVHKMICSGHGLENDGSAYYQWCFARAVRCSFWVILTGVIWLLDVLDILSWRRSWPLFLIAAGVVLLFKRTLFGGCGYEPGGHGSGSGQPGSAPPAPPVTSTDPVSGEPSYDHSGSDSGNDAHNDPEGR